MRRTALILAGLFSVTSLQAAEPIKIGITTILSGPFADRGQSEQYGAQLALDQINEAGGVLGRPLEAYYADNACKPEIGVPATQAIDREGACSRPDRRAVHARHARHHARRGGGENSAGDRDLGGPGFRRRLRRRRQRLRLQDHPFRSRYRARPGALSVVARRQIGRDRRRRRRLPASQRQWRSPKRRRTPGFTSSTSKHLRRGRRTSARRSTRRRLPRPTSVVTILGPSTAGFFQRLRGLRPENPGDRPRRLCRRSRRRFAGLP